MAADAVSVPPTPMAAVGPDPLPDAVELESNESVETGDPADRSRSPQAQSENRCARWLSVDAQTAPPAVGN